MNNRHHLCVGGPLDGKLVAQQDHIKRFNVALGPAKPFPRYDPSASAESPPVSISYVTYTLTRMTDGSLTWQA